MKTLVRFSGGNGDQTIQAQLMNYVVPVTTNRLIQAGLEGNRFLGVRNIPEGPIAIEAPGRDGVIIPAGEHPLYKDGTIFRQMPKENWNELNRALDAEKFEMIYILDETPPGTAKRIKAGEAIRKEWLMPASPQRRALALAKRQALTTSGQVQKAGRELAPYIKEGAIITGRAAKAAAPHVGKGLLYLAIGAGILALSPLLILGAAAGGDPAILGVRALEPNPQPGKTTGAWFLLTAWQWPVDWK